MNKKPKKNITEKYFERFNISIYEEQSGFFYLEYDEWLVNYHGKQIQTARQTIFLDTMKKIGIIE